MITQESKDFPEQFDRQNEAARIPANLSSVWCSAAVCCASGGRNPAQAKIGCFITQDVHISGFWSSGWISANRILGV